MVLERGKIRYRWKGPTDSRNVRFVDGKWIRNNPFTHWGRFRLAPGQQGS